MPGTISVRIETTNVELSKQLENIMHSIEGFKVDLSCADDNIDLLIYDIGSDVESDFTRIQFLMSENKDAGVFLTSARSDHSILMQAIRMGAKEFFAQPVNIEEVRSALKRLNIKTTRRVGDVLTVMGCKGGVGTTCVAVNLAVTLRRLRPVASVALIDMNLVFGEIPLFLNFKPKHTWAEIAKNINRMDDVFLNDNLFKHSSGIHVLPSPGTFQDTDGVTPQVFMRILSHMRRLFDFIVIDAGQSVSTLSMQTLQNSNRVLLVSLLSLPCLANTSKLLGTFDIWGYPAHEHTHVIINRYMQKSEITIEDCEKNLGKKVLWKIPNDYALTMSAINQGLPLSDVEERAEVTKSFQGLAKVFLPTEDARAAVTGKRFFKKMPVLKTLFGGST